jgi:hypothetical protein
MVASCLAVAVVALVSPADATAQGCVCQRQGGPLFGGLSPYMNPGDWSLQVFYRGYRSVEHFRGTNPLPELDENGPRNVQHYATAEAWYGVSRRVNLSLSVPLHVNSFDVRRSPPGGGERVWVPIGSSGIGDVALRARLWTLDPDGPTSGTRNIGLSLGVKVPTGSSDRTDDYFGRQVPVDVSIQTGDGSWAGTAALYGFQSLNRVTLYGTGSYLFNPTNTTGTPTFFGSLNNPDNDSLNSAADQFTAQVGASLDLKPGWPQPSLAYRIEGVPVSDLFGDSDGFRRPGLIGFIEPGLTLAVGPHLFSATMAIRAHVNIKDSPTSTRVEDATVPGFIFSAAWSLRF